jgi:homoserine/homoserine lactone efflux protein
MMSTSIWLSFVVASLFIIAAPGPSVTFLVTTSIIKGSKTAFSAIPGLLLGVFCSMMMSFLGVSAIFATSTMAYNALKTIGICYLLYLAFKTWTTNKPTIKKNKNNDKISIKTTFFISFLNPKSIIFYATFMPQFIDINGSYIRQAILLCITYLSLSLVTNFLYSFFGGKAGTLLNNKSSVNWIRKVGSVTMALSALMVFLKS